MCDFRLRGLAMLGVEVFPVFHFNFAITIFRVNASERICGLIYRPCGGRKGMVGQHGGIQ